MLHLAWILCMSLIPSVYADLWDKVLDDIEIYEGVMQQDVEDGEWQQQDAILDSASELFPVLEGEEEGSVREKTSEDETHITIRVDGVPLVLHDVPKSEWFANYVADVASLKLITGYRDSSGQLTGEFGPGDSITIEQLAKMAVLVAGIDQFSCKTTLRNTVARDRWSRNFIACAEEYGWIVFSDGTVELARPALRSEVVVTILQAFSRRISPVTGTMFYDVTRSTVYGNAIETAAEEGIVSGYSDIDGNLTGYFGANDRINRAEAAKMFSNAYSVYGD